MYFMCLYICLPGAIILFCYTKWLTHSRVWGSSEYLSGLDFHLPLPKQRQEAQQEGNTWASPKPLWSWTTWRSDSLTCCAAPSEMSHRQEKDAGSRGVVGRYILHIHPSTLQLLSLGSVRGCRLIRQNVKCKLLLLNPQQQRINRNCWLKVSSGYRKALATWPLDGAKSVFLCSVTWNQ